MPSYLYRKYVETVAGIPWLMKPLLKIGLFPRYWPPIQYGGTKEINEAMVAFAKEYGPFQICNFDGTKFSTRDESREPFRTFHKSYKDQRDRRIAAKRQYDSYMRLMKEVAEKMAHEEKKRVNKSKDKPVSKKKRTVSPVRTTGKGRGKVGTGTRNPRGNGRKGR